MAQTQPQAPSLLDLNIQMFDQQAQNWDNKHGIKDLAIQAANELLAKAPSATTCLDVGCGSGLVSELLASRLKQVVGVDPSSGMCEAFNAKTKQHLNMTAVCADILKKDSFQQALKDAGLPSSYDLVFCHMTLHHVEDVPAMIEAMTQLVTPKSGIIALSDIEKTPISHLFHKPGAHHTVSHHGGFEPSYIAGLLEKAGNTSATVYSNAMHIEREFEEPDGVVRKRQHSIFMVVANKP